MSAMEKHPLSFKKSLEVSLKFSTTGSPQKKNGALGREKERSDPWGDTLALSHRCLPWPFPLHWLGGQLCPQDALQQQRDSFLQILKFKCALTFQVITERLPCLLSQTQMNNCLCFAFTMCLRYTGISLCSQETGE